jgi:hypothetical protein
MSDFSQDLIVRDANGRQRLWFRPNIAEADLRLMALNGQPSFFLKSGNNMDNACNLTLGNTEGIPGNVLIQSGDGNKVAFELSGKNASLTVGNHLHKGDIFVKDHNNKKVLQCDGADAHLIVGGVENSERSKSGQLSIRHRFGVDVLRFNAETGHLEIGNFQATPPERGFLLDGFKGHLTIGSAGHAGLINVHNKLGRTAQLDGSAGNLTLGAWGTDGDITLRNTGGSTGAQMFIHNISKSGVINLHNPNGPTVELDGSAGNLRLGGWNKAGNFELRNEGGAARVQMGLDTKSKGGLIHLRNNKGETTLSLDGGAGDIGLSGADVAEEFYVFDSDNIDEGTVLVFDEDDDRLAISTKEYDNKVAGIVSGTTERKPALILDKMINSKDRRIPLALVGKVLCKVDATFGSISRGDMLTSSSTPGHAMKATDPLKSFGAVVGKALRPLKSGKGIIEVLATLQ